MVTIVFVSPAFAGKTHWDCFFPFVCENGKHLAISSNCFDGFQLNLGQREPSVVDEVKSHIPRSRVIRGQVVRLAENVKLVSLEKLKSDWKFGTILDL